MIAKCAVRGLIRPGAMCGNVIVGGDECGYPWACKYKVEPGSDGPQDAVSAAVGGLTQTAVER